MDFASNFVTIKPLKTRTSKEILQKFLEHVATFGIPDTVRHDNEKGITDGEFKKFCDTNMIEQITGLPNKGQTNGRVEAQIRNIKYALRSTTTSNSTKDKWKDELRKIQLSMYNAVSTATDMSPETMMFGYPLPLRATTLIQLDCPSQQELEGGISLSLIHI